MLKKGTGKTLSDFNKGDIVDVFHGPYTGYGGKITGMPPHTDPKGLYINIWQPGRGQFFVRPEEIDLNKNYLIKKRLNIVSDAD